MEPARGRSRSPRASAGPAVPGAYPPSQPCLQSPQLDPATGFDLQSIGQPQPQLALAADAQSQVAQQPAMAGMPQLAAAPGMPALPDQLPGQVPAAPGQAPEQTAAPGQMTAEQQQQYLKAYQEQAYQQYLAQYQQQMAYALAMQQQQQLMMASMQPGAMQAMLLQQQALLGGLPVAGASTPKHSIDSMQSPAAKSMTANGDVPGVTDKRYETKVVMLKAGQFGFLACPADLSYHLNGKDIFINKSDIASFNIGDVVSFGVKLLPDGKPQAKDMSLVSTAGA